MHSKVNNLSPVEQFRSDNNSNADIEQMKSTFRGDFNYQILMYDTNCVYVLYLNTVN
jgi:hypothetical protein